MLRKVLWAGVGACALLFGANKWGYDYLVVPSLLKMDPERAHRMAIRACRLGLVPQTFRNDPKELVCKYTLVLSFHIASMNTVHVYVTAPVCICVSVTFSIQKSGRCSSPIRLVLQQASISMQRQ